MRSVITPECQLVVGVDIQQQPERNRVKDCMNKQYNHRHNAINESQNRLGKVDV